MKKSQPKSDRKYLGQKWAIPLKVLAILMALAGALVFYLKIPNTSSEIFIGCACMQLIGVLVWLEARSPLGLRRPDENIKETY